MTRRLRDERGGVLVMAAVMIPVFLALDRARRRRRELVHAQAPAPESRRRRCVRRRRRVRQELEGLRPDRGRRPCARRPAARSQTRRASTRATPRRPTTTGTLPTTLRNTEIANQGPRRRRSTRTTRTTPTTPTTPTAAAGRPQGEARASCTDRRRHLGAAGHWTDVRVKERDLPSLFGSVGLPLSRNGARARIEIRPAISGHRFLPLAVPNNVITQVQVRYYDECRDPARTRCSRRCDLEPLPTANQAPSRGGRTLWASRPADFAGGPRPGVQLTLPAYGGCGQAYLPIGVEVRIASRDRVDLNTARARSSSRCSSPTASPALADPRLERRRPRNQVRIDDVRPHAAAAAASADAYFGTLPSPRPTAASAPNVDVNWGDRDDAEQDVPANFSVTVNGVAAAPPGARAARGRRFDTCPATRSPDARAQHVTVTIDWVRHDHVSDDCDQATTAGTATATRASTSSEPVHRAFVGTTGTARRGRTRGHARAARGAGRRPGRATPYADPASPAGPRHRSTRRSGSAACSRRASTRRSASTTRRRTRRSAATPTTPRGRSSRRSATGVSPWYGEPTASLGTPTHDSWWNPATKTCPGRPVVPLRPGRGLRRRTRATTRGVRPHRTGLSTGQIGDDIAAATDNCDNINNNSCQRSTATTTGTTTERARPTAGVGDDRSADSSGSARRTRASSTCSSCRTRRARA